MPTGLRITSHNILRVRGLRLHQCLQRSRGHMTYAAGSAYIDPELRVTGSDTGPLIGKTFAVKDLFDVRGSKTGFGNPKWLETHDIAMETCPAVQLLLNSGASVRGKTHMDELAYSLNGENMHYGVPSNPAAPGRIPGGSSSGSASACASGDVDFALGSDTGGSVRVPASYCGLYGFRPTHGRISLDLAQPLAPSFDTVGFFTREAPLMREVGKVLLSPTRVSENQKPLKRWLVSKDAFALAQPDTSKAIYDALTLKFKEVVEIIGAPTELDVGSHEIEGVGALSTWFDVFRICQGWEVWQAHGSWVQKYEPVFGPGIRERFDMASKITNQERDAYTARRKAIKGRLDMLLQEDGMLALPTAPGPAPLINTPAPQLDEWRRSMITLTCIAGLSGLPQVTIPIARAGGLPVGLSLIGPEGRDEELLEVAVRLALLLQC
ncbi:hypothetical protein CEUSTIGMA_g10284.t1 [Chlamydomonas eustigma]|uniref:Amidase domain-containing protein n=1 Tax=Chlamydomonas eustigma TaxID=1157962 RepID=A0A250XIF1_9CHLO|nr:hypothetical protein CEUSTIGMA_g10284.t1 [Chlamydomonas eustigma]|eukprot:GAX82858.1 hypothetical protein CEUSTIGMA_g10284.t1 [Chlamydomonas eustigma]